MNSQLGTDLATPVNRWRRVLIAQLIVSVAGWGFFCWQGYGGEPGTAATFYFSLLMWMCSVLGLWAGLGRARWRWLVIVPSAPTIGWISSLDTNEVYEFELFCLGIVAIVTVTTAVLRRFCGHLSIQSATTENVDGLRFGIKQILVWTGLAAVALSVARVLVIQFDAIGAVLNDLETTLKICGLSLGISTAVVINIWAMLGSRISVLKLLTVVGMTALAMFINQKLLDHFLFAASTLITQLLMVITLTTLRRQGYRFVRVTDTPSLNPS